MPKRLAACINEANSYILLNSCSFHKKRWIRYYAFIILFSSFFYCIFYISNISILIFRFFGKILKNRIEYGRKHNSCPKAENNKKLHKIIKKKLHLAPNGSERKNYDNDHDYNLSFFTFIFNIRYFILNNLICRHYCNLTTHFVFFQFLCYTHIAYTCYKLPILK